jgi:dipeptidyl aminopeptidase/acylaminoacyl peptidase
MNRGAADIVGETYPMLANAELGTFEATSYKARDGVSIPVYVTVPPKVEPIKLPLVVLPHGGPQSRDDIGFDWLAQFLATRGYAVLQPQAGTCRTTSRMASDI